MGTTDTRGTRPAATARRRHGVLPGQAYIFIALAMPALCGMLALAVDVGTTTARYQALQHAADNAAQAGAYALYGSRIGATSSLTDTGVWNAMASKLTAQGLRVMNAPGGSVPQDPCAAGYLTNQVAMTATYLDATDNIITTPDNTSWVVGSGSIPRLASGASVTLGGCQPAGFGGVLGHPTYTIWVNGSAGHWLPGPIDTPTPDAHPIPLAPYSVSGARDRNCPSGHGVDTTNYTPTVGGIDLAFGDPLQFYCKGVYWIGDTVVFYANGAGLGNNYGSDSSFKGYTGGIPYLGAELWVHSGGGNNGPSSCPPQVTVPIITGVDHIHNSDWFVPLETVVLTGTVCSGNQATGIIQSVYDPYGFGVVASTPTLTPTTPLPTVTPPPTPAIAPPVVHGSL
jgi:Flp pilus assembly protein TadG